MLQVNAFIAIPDSEFSWSFVRASGPGGQNVNKVASKAVLRWNVRESPSLPPEVKSRMAALFPSRFTTAGEILVQSQRFRDQEKNRQDCLDKLRDLVRPSAVRPKPRKATKPSRGSRERRLETKRRRAADKARRRLPDD